MSPFLLFDTGFAGVPLTAFSDFKSGLIARLPLKLRISQEKCRIICIANGGQRNLRYCFHVVKSVMVELAVANLECSKS
jgi:hypothetical protein